MKLRVERREVDAARLPFFEGLPSVLARAYAARGIDDPIRLSTRLERLLPVSSLDGVAAAVELLLEHRRRGGLILVIGDFDADGATSTALMMLSVPPVVTTPQAVPPGTAPPCSMCASTGVIPEMFRALKCTSPRNSRSTNITCRARAASSSASGMAR